MKLNLLNSVFSIPIIIIGNKLKCHKLSVDVRCFFLLIGTVIIITCTSAQCTPVEGASGIVQNTTMTTSIDFTITVSSTASIANLGSFTGVCGFVFPSIVAAWSGNTQPSIVTYTFSNPIISTDLIIGATGVITLIRPETFVFNTNGSIPSLVVDSGTCMDWTIT